MNTYSLWDGFFHSLLFLYFDVKSCNFDFRMSIFLLASFSVNMKVIWHTLEALLFFYSYSWIFFRASCDYTIVLKIGGAAFTPVRFVRRKIRYVASSFMVEHTLLFPGSFHVCQSWVVFSTCHQTWCGLSIINGYELTTCFHCPIGWLDPMMKFLWGGLCLLLTVAVHMWLCQAGFAFWETLGAPLITLKELAWRAFINIWRVISICSNIVSEGRVLYSVWCIVIFWWI
jgi:hypothetical protein